MQIVDGVHLHFIKTEKFKTNHLTIRFSGDLTRVNQARRALVAQMLATASRDYPTSKQLRRRLAELYGSQLTTRINTRGLVHQLDLDISFMAPHYLPKRENLVGEILELVQGILFRPLVSLEQFQPKTFQIEKDNLIHYLETDKEDLYYTSDLELDKLYFSEPYLQIPKYSTPEEVAKETAFTAYQELVRLLAEDRIDLFFVGQFEEYEVIQQLMHWPFAPRQISLSPLYDRSLSSVIREKVERRQTNQSILELAYHSSQAYDSDHYASLLVFNGMLGGFSHSLLFTQIREKEGLAYTISSHLSPFLGVMKIQAGIAKSHRLKTVKLISNQLKDLKSGRFSVALLAKTKSMLINGLKLAADHPKALIEQTYQKEVLSLAKPNLLDDLAAVTKADVMAIGKTLTLQALYFLEGED